MASFGNNQDISVRVSSTGDTKGIDSTTSALERMNLKTVAVGSALGTLAADGLKVAAQSLFDMGKQAVQSAGEFEQSRVAFTVMLGSADKARAMMSDIAKFAKETPFELPEVVSGTKQLLAFGFAQKDLIPTMRKLGDVAAGVGVPIGQLTNVYGQVRVAGKLMGGDLLQFTNAGVPMIEALSKTMGKSQGDIKDLVSQGKVGFKEVEAAMNSLTDKGSKFGGMMDKQSQTFDGVVSNLQDGFGQILRQAVGMDNAGDIVKGGFFDRIKNAANDLLPVVSNLATNIGPFVQGLLVWFDKTADSGMKLFRSVADYLSPKLVDLGRTISTDVIPMLSNLWHNVLEPLMPVIGTTLVLAVGFLVDALNGLLRAVTPVINFMIEHKQAVLDLAAAFGILKLALKFDSIKTSFLGNMKTITDSINGTKGAVTKLFTKIGGGAVMGGIVTTGAMADIALVMQAVQSVIGAINAMNQAKEAQQRNLDQTAAMIKRNAEIQSGPYSAAVKKRYQAAVEKAIAIDAGHKYASGTVAARGGMALVGENGPEVVEMPRGAKVHTAADTRRMLQGGTGRGGDINVTQHIYNSVDYNKGIEELGFIMRTA